MDLCGVVMRQASTGGGPTGNQSSGSNIWLWIGGGCLGVLLIGAIVLAFGAYKGVTCCQQALERQSKARKLVREFAGQLRDGDYEAAYEQLSPRYRDRLSREEFTSTVRAHRDRLAGTFPILVGMNRQFEEGSDDDSRQAWAARVGFMPREGEELLVGKFRLVMEEVDGEAIFHVDDVEFERREREIAEEPPARIVEQFHDNFSEGDRESSRRFVAGARVDAGSASEAWSIVESHEAIFEAIGLEVLAVGYRPPDGAVVDVRHRSESGETHLVRYRLTRGSGGWHVTDVAVDPPDLEAPDDAADGLESGGPDAGPSSSPDATGASAPDPGASGD